MAIGHKQKIVVDASKREPIPYTFITKLYAENPGKKCPKTESVIATLIGLNFIKKVDKGGITYFMAV